MKCWIIISLSIFSSWLSTAQNRSTLSGTVYTSEGFPLEFVNIVLHTTKDSAYVDYAISDPDGKFIIHGLLSESYYLIASFIGLPNYYSDTFTIISNLDFILPDIIFSPSKNALEEIEISATRPLIEMKADKMVFNVSGSIQANANDAVELLSKSPGVIISNDETILLMGQEGVEILIDGKTSPFSGSDLIDFLRSIQPAEIDQIEIITNPSSQYDAKGTAGIINLKLKKDKKLGLNSILNTGYSIGKKGNFKASLNSNYKEGKFNLFGYYSYKNGGRVNERSTLQEQTDIIYVQKNISLSKWDGNSFKVGMDYDLHKFSTIGLLLSGKYTNISWIDDGRIEISRPNTSVTENVLISAYELIGYRNSLNYNLNYRFENDKGNSLVLDFDYYDYMKSDQTDQPNFVYDGEEQNLLRQDLFENETENILDFWAVKVDYETSINNDVLKLGIKRNNSETDNDFKYFETLDSMKVLRADRTNHFLYSERITAAYFQYMLENKLSNFYIGLRGEYTSINGIVNSLEDLNNSQFKRQYIDFFPSAGMSVDLGKNNSLQINYSRRINRPSYKDLNPFVIQKDELNIEQGNSALSPEYTEKVGITYGINYQLYASLNYSRTKGKIVNVRDTVLGSNIILKQPLNLAEKRNYGIHISYSTQLSDWWSSYNSLSAYHVENISDDARITNASAKSIYVYSQQYISFPKNFSLEISGWYNSPTIFGASFESESIWSLDLGLRKKFWDKRAKISLSISDIFRSSGWYGVSQFEGLTVTTSGIPDSRKFSVSFSYLLGNKKLKQNKRKTSSEEETRIDTE